MKKIRLLIFLVLLATFMSLFANAKTVSENGNFEFGDTVAVYGNPGTKVFGFNVEYSGTLRLDFNFTGSRYTSEDIMYVLYIHEATREYTTGERWNITVPSETTRSYQCYIELSLSPGYYRITLGSFSLSMWADSSPYWDMYIYPTFKCHHNDTYTYISKNPTCLLEGEKTTKCNVCKEIIKTIKLDKLPHTDGTEWVNISQPTCSQVGENVVYCTVCNEVSKRQELEKLPHTYGDWSIDREAICSKPGQRSRVCSVCQYTDIEEIIVEHEYDSWTTTKKSSCTEDGEKVRTCLVCEYEEKEKIAKNEHDWGEWKTEKEASETSQGSEFRICDTCYQTEEKTIPKLIHGEKFEWEEVVKVTCTENGLLSKYCLYCDRRIESKTIIAEGHDFTDWVIIEEPRVGKPGRKERICKKCSDSEDQYVTLTHGEYGSWEITKEATCNEMGQKAFTCRCCNKVTETENIPKLTHKFSDWYESVRALPEREGTLQRVCNLCSKAEEKSEKYSFSTLKNKTKIIPNFKDVASNAWYKDVVANCYHYSLMLGNSETTFNPTGNITIAEVITAAVRIYCLNNTYASKPTMNTTPWYKGYVDYAISKKIIKADDFSDYTLPATRAEMAYILKNCVTSSKLKKINTITSIPDVTKEDKYGEEIFKLYEAGILGGSDEKGTFFPDRSITRAEGAAIIARLSEISDRIKK